MSVGLPHRELPKSLVVDSQVHMWDRVDDPPDGWAGGRAIREEELLAEMDQAGVDAVVLVPPGHRSTTANDYALGAAIRRPNKFGVMGVVRLDRPENENQKLIHGWRDTSHMIGLRLSFSREPERTWLRDGTASWIWKLCATEGLPIMVNAPGQLGFIEDVARQYPSLKLIVDHFGLHVAEAHLPLDARLAALLPLSKRPNVAVKASALPLQALGGYPFERIHSSVRLVIQEFGRERVFWGSDLSRLSCSYVDCVRLFKEGLSFLSDLDREWILGTGLVSWLGWSIAKLGGGTP